MSEKKRNHREVGRVKDVKLLREFRAFIMRGNVLDLAVGIIIGIAFGGVVNSMVNDVVMPPIGAALGGVDLKEAYIVLKPGTPGPPYASVANATAAGAVTLRYGAFLNAVINFLIVAFAVFMMVWTVGKMRAREKEKEEQRPTEKECPHCFMKIPIRAVRCGFCTSTLEAAVT